MQLSTLKNSSFEPIDPFPCKKLWKSYCVIGAILVGIIVQARGGPTRSREP